MKVKITFTGIDWLRDELMTADHWAIMRRQRPDCEQVYIKGDKHTCKQIVDAVFVDEPPYPKHPSLSGPKSTEKPSSPRGGGSL